MINRLAKITLENAGQLQVVGTLEGHTAPILSIDIAPGGQLLASGSMDGTVRIWNVQTAQQVSVLAGSPEQEKIHRVAFSPTNPNHLAAAIGYKLAWETPGSYDNVNTLVADMIGSLWQDKPVWRLWSLETNSVVHTEEARTNNVGTAGLAYSRDGRWLAANDSVFDLINEPSSRVDHLTGCYVNDVAFSDDAQLLALVSTYEKHPENITYHFVEIFQAGSWRKVAKIEEARRISDFSTVRFRPDSHDLLVRTSQDPVSGGGIHDLYHVKGDSFEEITRVLSDVACFAWHPDGGMVAIARYDGRMVLLDWARQKPVATVQAYKPAEPVKLPMIMIGGRGNLFDAMQNLYRASAGMVFSQDGRLLVSADGDRVIRLWGVPA